MAEQVKAGVGGPVGVGVVVGAALEVISIQLPSVKPHWHPQSTGEQSGSASQSEPLSSRDSSPRASSWKREPPRGMRSAPKPADANDICNVAKSGSITV